MSHYEERLEADRRKIAREVQAVGERVEAAQQAAIEALLSGDRALAYRTVLDDLPVNRRVRRIDRRCHAFVAQHLPSAGHLRWVSSVLRLNVSLERIGDYASTIGRSAVQLTQTPPEAVARDLELMADQGRRVLSQAMRSWNEGNAEMARGTLGMAAQASGAAAKVFADLLDAGDRGERPIGDLFALLTVFNRLGRVAAQAKNICEETIFAVTGETKAPKTYRLLFVDEKDDCWTQLAVAQARKAFPDSGHYASAGWAPAEALEPRCRVFMDRHHLDPTSLEPTRLDSRGAAFADAHVIVSLGGDPRPHVERIPYKTVVLDWQVGTDLTDLDQERAESQLRDGLRDLSARLTELMELLHGEEVV
ncbi:MAG: PhoU domain-containing protein [Acidobacteriota bacterium]